MHEKISEENERAKWTKFRAPFEILGGAGLSGRGDSDGDGREVLENGSRLDDGFQRTRPGDLGATRVWGRQSPPDLAKGRPKSYPPLESFSGKCFNFVNRFPRKRLAGKGQFLIGLFGHPR